MDARAPGDEGLGPAPMKGNVLLVANWESDVGYAWWLMESFWVAIAERYSSVGSRILLIYPVLNELPAAIEAAPLDVEERRFESSGFLETVRFLLLLRRRRIRNVYLSDSPHLRPLYLLMRLAGVRRIVIHDHTPGDREPTRGWRRTIKRLIREVPWIHADFFVAVTDFVRSRLIENANLPPDRCGVARNGIVPISANESDIDVRRTFGFPDDAVVVVTTGRANRYKGIDFIISLADRIVNQGGMTQVYFLYCGDGPHIGAFRRMSEALGLGPHFTFAGRRGDVRALLGDCDIAIQASHGEVGYSLSILEYMSAGLATLVPDRPSVSLATQHQVTGLVYPPGDLDAAAALIERLVDDPELRRALGERATEVVERRYRLDQTRHQLLALLDREFV